MREQKEENVLATIQKNGVTLLHRAPTNPEAGNGCGQLSPEVRFHCLVSCGMGRGRGLTRGSKREGGCIYHQ